MYSHSDIQVSHRCYLSSNASSNGSGLEYSVADHQRIELLWQSPKVEVLYKLGMFAVPDVVATYPTGAATYSTTTTALHAVDSHQACGSLFTMQPLLSAWMCE